MGAFGYFQLLVDVAFCFLILLLLVGRSWRRGTGASADQETYREMISTLSALIREMKEGAAEMDRQLESRHAEVAQAVASADIRLQQLEAAMLKAAPLDAGGPAAVRIPADDASHRAVRPGGSRPGPQPAPPPPADESGEMDDDERREKYRQALDFARKGWDVGEIVRHTRLPRGEVELLVRTKGPGV
ncbi:MAG: hypothetical protein AAB152_07465 [Candidatus Coatesbacteria bacterium]